MSRHPGVNCDVCSKREFSLRRYKCLICLDYDLCGECFDRNAESELHVKGHPMICMLTRNQADFIYRNDSVPEGILHTYVCPLCCKDGFSHSDVIDHISYCNELKFGTSVICPICAGSSVSYLANYTHADLGAHIKSDHTKDDRGNIKIPWSLSEGNVINNSTVSSLNRANRTRLARRNLRGRVSAMSVNGSSTDGGGMNFVPITVRRGAGDAADQARLTDSATVQVSNTLGNMIVLDRPVSSGIFRLLNVDSGAESPEIFSRLRASGLANVRQGSQPSSGEGDLSVRDRVYLIDNIEMLHDLLDTHPHLIQTLLTSSSGGDTRVNRQSNQPDAVESTENRNKYSLESIKSNVSSLLLKIYDGFSGNTDAITNSRKPLLEPLGDTPQFSSSFMNSYVLQNDRDDPGLSEAIPSSPGVCDFVLDVLLALESVSLSDSGDSIGNS